MGSPENTRTRAPLCGQVLGKGFAEGFSWGYSPENKKCVWGSHLQSPLGHTHVPHKVASLPHRAHLLPDTCGKAG